MLVNDSTAYVQCATTGFGIVQVPGLLVERFLEEGSLVEVLADYRPPARPVSLVYPSKAYLTPQLKAFIAWVQLHFRDIAPKWLQIS